MKSNIYVGNLSYDIENSDLEKLFADVGNVVAVNVIRDQESGRARGFGFVEMETASDAEKAISNLNDKNFMGRSLIVNMAKTTKKKSHDRY
ncbi:RNA-binding protein [Halobacteriovorax sp. XZX-3]|uniref:RNA recognition motif domain-containing protein n=1 Tax=unclassified Halobacteriovorax TaxID=2639665 RepID=UPI000CD22FD2|nr:RNA-binding protein [Halobacteriovorax sp. DA5]POB13578.1 RNA-binding protein [Halobacteriovorax sp. DA5]